MPDHLTPDPLAAALARLRPAPAAAEKPAFLFRAGQASRDALVRRWQVVAVAAAVALAGSWVYGLISYSELQHRAATAEAHALELKAQLAGPPIPPPSSTVEPSVPVARAFPVPDAPPAPVASSYEPDPTPEELADALRQRNEILTAGLTLLPPSRAPTGNDLRRALPGGVFATPQLEPKKPTPLFPDDDE